MDTNADECSPNKKVLPLGAPSSHTVGRGLDLPHATSPFTDFEFPCDIIETRLFQATF